MSKPQTTASPLPDVALCATASAHITPSNATDMKFLANTNASDRQFGADIDHLNESLYKLNKFMRLTKDIDDMKRQQSVGRDIQRKLSLKEQWLKNTASPVPSAFSRGSSMYGSTQSVNSLASQNSHGSGAAKPAGTAPHVKQLEQHVIEFKSPAPLNPEVDDSESKFISQSKIVVPSSSAVQPTTEAELFGTVDSSTLKLHKSCVDVSDDDEAEDDDDLRYLDALELNDAEIRELTQPLRDTSAIDHYRREAQKQTDLKKALKKIELKNFADTFSHIQSQFTGPKVSTDTARDLSKFFPKKEEPAVAGAVNKTQKELKDVDLAKYFAPSPVQQRKTFGFAKDMAAKGPKRTVAASLVKTRSTEGAKENEFDMFGSQLDGAMDLRVSVKPFRVADKIVKPKTTVKVKVAKPKTAIIKKQQSNGHKMSKSCSTSTSKSEASEFDEGTFDRLFEAKPSASRTLRTRNESEASSTSSNVEHSASVQFDRMFTNDDLDSSEVEQVFEQVAKSSGIKPRPKPPANKQPAKKSSPPLKTQATNSVSLEKYFSDNSDAKNLTYHEPSPTWCKKPTPSQWEKLELRMMSAMPSSLQAQIRQLELQIAVDEPLSILEDFDFDTNMDEVVGSNATNGNCRVVKKKTSATTNKPKTIGVKKVKATPGSDDTKVVVKKAGKKKTNGVRKASENGAESKSEAASNGHFATMDEMEEKVLMELAAGPRVKQCESKPVLIDMPQEGVSSPKASQSPLYQEVQLNDVPQEGFMLSVTNSPAIPRDEVVPPKPLKPLRRKKSNSFTSRSSPEVERKESDPVIELYHISKVMNTSSSESHGSSDIGANANVEAAQEPPIKKVVFKYKPLSSVGRDIIDYPLYPKPLKVASPERAELGHIGTIVDEAVSSSDDPTASPPSAPRQVQPIKPDRNSREASPFVSRHSMMMDEPIRPTRRQRIEADATDRLLERSQAIHNRKQDFINEKLSHSNPYLRRAQENQSRESLLSTGSNEQATSSPYTITKDMSEYRRSKPLPRYNPEHTYSTPSTAYSTPSTTYSTATTTYASPRCSLTSLQRLALGKPEYTTRDYRSEDYRNPMVDRLARTYPASYTSTSTSARDPSHNLQAPKTANSSRFNIFKRSPVTSRKSRKGKKDGCIIA